MSTDAFAQLRELLVSRYQEIKVKLTRRLQSEDLAEQVMQEVFLRLNSGTTKQPDDLIHKPEAFLFRMAFNIATDLRRQERRHLRLVEQVEQFQPSVGSTPHDNDLQNKATVDALRKALQVLPERRRQILIAARIYGLGREEIAIKLGISRTIVQKELRLALSELLKVLDVSGTHEGP